MKTETKNPNKEVGMCNLFNVAMCNLFDVAMRNLLGTAVAAVVLSIVLLPNCAGTANAGMSVTVSVGASAGYGCPGEGYEYSDIDYYDEDVMDWDNVIILNDNLVGFWVLLPGNHWALRCRSMWYNSGSLEWTFGPWWYDYSISYDCRCNGPYYNRYCPVHGVRFHTYMVRHYPRWHSHYFVYSYNRYQPRVERHIIVNRGRYIRHDEPAIYRQHSITRTHIEQNRQCRPVTDERAIMINHTSNRSIEIDKGNRTERINDNNNIKSRQSQVTRSRSMTINNGNNGNSHQSQVTRTRSVTINNGNNGNSHQSEVTRSRSVTREKSNGNGNSSIRTRNDTRSSSSTKVPHNRK